MQKGLRKVKPENLDLAGNSKIDEAVGGIMQLVSATQQFLFIPLIIERTLSDSRFLCATGDFMSIYLI